MLLRLVLKETFDLSRAEVRKGISHVAAAGLDTSGWCGWGSGGCEASCRLSVVVTGSSQAVLAVD